MTFGVAAYSIVRDTEKEAQRELARITDVKQSAAGYDELPAMAGWHKARSTCFARRLFR